MCVYFQFNRTLIKHWDNRTQTQINLPTKDLDSSRKSLCFNFHFPAWLSATAIIRGGMSSHSTKSPPKNWLQLPSSESLFQVTVKQGTSSLVTNKQVSQFTDQMPNEQNRLTDFHFPFQSCIWLFCHLCEIISNVQKHNSGKKTFMEGKKERSSYLT